MKKIIPVIVVFLILLAIAGGYGAKFVFEKYSYGKERADLEEYFEISGEGDTAVILQNARIDDRAYIRDGVVYFDLEAVHRLFTDRLYHNRAEEVILYTFPTYTESVRVGDSVVSSRDGDRDMGYTIALYRGEQLYIALDFIKRYVNLSYEHFSDPDRIQLYTEWGEQETAAINKNTWIRYRGGLKSEILTDIEKGDTVEILEEMEEWTKVKARGCFIGYVENKRLGQKTTVSQIPVDEVQEPDYTSRSFPSRINMAWHHVFARQGAEDLRAILAQTKGINIVSPTWFSLKTNEGEIADLGTEEYVRAAHDMGLQVWAVFDNDLNNQYGTQAAVFMADSQARKTAIDALMSLADKYGFDGINLDFESIVASAGEDYIQFVRELSVACRLHELYFSIDNYAPTEGSRHYHRGEQGVMADYVVIMGYDEHWGGGGKAGSVASIGFVENGIANTIAEGVPAEKIVNGIPFYARVWKTKGGEVTSEALGMTAQQDFVKRVNLPIAWDDETCQNYGEMMSGDTLYQIWMEDEASIKTKLNVMENYGLAGVAEWKLGLDNQSIWDTIMEYASH